MTTNQTIDGVPRELLERVTKPLTIHDDLTDRIKARDELRALLDADECCHEFVPFQANCTKCGIPYKPAAQPQGEPVAWIKPDVAKTLTKDECCYAFGSQNPKGTLIPLYAGRTEDQ